VTREEEIPTSVISKDSYRNEEYAENRADRATDI
jgi:hypothetical protein